MKILIIAIVASTCCSFSAEARPPRPTEVTPPPPNNEIGVFLRTPLEQRVEAMASRTLLVNGVFFSRYAEVIATAPLPNDENGTLVR